MNSTKIVPYACECSSSGYGGHGGGLPFCSKFRRRGRATILVRNQILDSMGVGAGLGIWGAINLMEGYGNDNPGSNAHVR